MRTSRAATGTGWIAAFVVAPLAPAAGSGQFIESGQVFGDNLATLAVSLADLDGDGDLDAVTPTYVGPAHTWINDGTGHFSAGPVIDEISGFTLPVGDLNGDGLVDVFLVSVTTTKVFLNDGDLTFVDTAQTLEHIGGGADIGDVDGDGDLDIFAGMLGGWTNSMIENDGSGSFTAHGRINGAAAKGVALGDLDGDGDLDAFLARSNSPSDGGPNGVQLNDGSGVFTETDQEFGASSSDHVALADLDGDGDLDAFIGNNAAFDSNPADTVWLNDGSGFFTDSGQQLGTLGTSHVALGDLDDDGDVDAVTAHVEPDQIWINDGSGQFTAGQQLGGNEATPQLALGDLDGDGDLDAFSNGGGTGERVYFNTDMMCEADIAGVDAMVNVTDLLELLANWGTDGAGADLAEPIDTVNVVDLLELLAAWGPC